MRKAVIIVAVSLFLGLTGCGQAGQEAVEEVQMEKNSYQQIIAEEAKSRMDEHADVIILDVREQSEYDESHIPGAVLLPVGTINEESAAALIPDKEAEVLVYCRSGNRSKKAAQALADLGYTGIYEFGGIMDWPYEVE